MRTRRIFTPERRAEVRRLLGRRLKENRAAQKSTRRVLREDLDFYVGEFKWGLTPQEFDALFADGTLRQVE